MDAGDPTTAVNLLTQAVARCPDELDYAHKLAEARAAAGLVPAAVHLLNDLIAKHPNHAGLRITLAETYALDKNWSAVIDALAPRERELQPDQLVLLANAYAQAQQPRRAESLLQRVLTRWRDSERLWLALIDHALRQNQAAVALQRVCQAQHQLGPTPQTQFRAAQAHYRLGKALGQTRVMRVPNHRAGQFFQEWLLIEKRREPDWFLCCPRESALYALRQALDAGLDEPAAHCLHARIWQQAGHPEVGLAILQSREAVLLADATPETVATFADLALAADAMDAFLRYARQRAALELERRGEILHDAYRAAAERYNQRGDEAMYRELLRRALALQPEDVELMLQLADSLWNAGVRNQATIWYRRVLECAPGHPQRTRILERLAD